MLRHGLMCYAKKRVVAFRNSLQIFKEYLIHHVPVKMKTANVSFMMRVWNEKKWLQTPLKIQPLFWFQITNRLSINMLLACDQ